MSYTIEYKNGWWYYGTIGLAVTGALQMIATVLMIATMPFVVNIAMTIK